MIRRPSKSAAATRVSVPKTPLERMYQVAELARRGRLIARLSSSFCASCTRDIPSTEKPRYAPLGRNDALVRVCARCDTETVSYDDGRRGRVLP